MSKDEILQAVWPGIAVEESNLTVQISKLRRVLDKGRKQSFIQTLPGRGYRFTAAVSEPKLNLVHLSPEFTLPDKPPVAVLPFQEIFEDPNTEFTDAGLQEVKNIAEPVHVIDKVAGSIQPARAPVAASAPLLALPEKPSVAVLPFTNMSTDPEQEFIADGIAADIITALSRFPSLFVIARTSSFIYKGRTIDVKQVGRELGVRYVLEGSCAKPATAFEQTRWWWKPPPETNIWAERYDRDVADIFAMQDDITTEVVIAIAPAIADAELQRVICKPPGSLDAWVRISVACGTLVGFLPRTPPPQSASFSRRSSSIQAFPADTAASLQPNSRLRTPL